MQIVFFALIFLMVFLVLAGAFMFLGKPREAKIIRDRLEAIERGTTYNKANLSLGLVRDELLSSIPILNQVLVRWSWPARLRNFIGQAGMKVRAGKLILTSGVIGLVAYEVAQVFYGTFWISLAIGVPAALAPFIFVVIMRARRMAAFDREFPEVIELLSRSVRAGHSFTSGMEIVASDLPEPAATEFRVTFDEQRYGLPLRDALMNLCERVPSVDVRLFVIALLVQKETGGNLAEILDNLAHVIRERFRIKGEIRVRTAQGRMTAGILMALPLIMMIMLHSLDPEYLSILFTDKLGQLLLITAGIMQVVGAFVVWRIVDIKV